MPRDIKVAATAVHLVHFIQENFLEKFMYVVNAKLINYSGWLSYRCLIVLHYTQSLSPGKRLLLEGAITSMAIYLPFLQFSLVR